MRFMGVYVNGQELWKIFTTHKSIHCRKETKQHCSKYEHLKAARFYLCPSDWQDGMI